MNPIAAISPDLASPLPQALDHALAGVRDLMSEHLAAPEPAVQQLVDAAQRYHGKMLRPTLVFAAGLAAHPEADTIDPSAAITRDHVVIAAVLETIHLATLVHDDVLDEADVRRGAPTVNRISGNERSVILGDYLFARAYHLCSTLQDQRVALRVGEVTSQVCRGEMLQLASRGSAELTEDDYFRIIDGKTAALIAAACELGAHASGASPDVCAGFARFGRNIGLSFQIRDDLLDLTGDASVVGKPLGRDFELGKLTLPLIHHLAATDPAHREGLRARIATPERLNGHRGELIADLERTGSIDHAQRVASDLVAGAKRSLEGLPPSPARSGLAAIADRVIARSR